MSLYAGTTSTHYTKVTSIRYQIISKKGTTWYIDVNSWSACSSQGSLLLSLDTTLQFCKPAIKKVWTTINGMPHQLFQQATSKRHLLWAKKVFLQRTIERNMHISENCLGRILRCLAINLKKIQGFQAWFYLFFAIF